MNNPLVLLRTIILYFATMIVQIIISQALYACLFCPFLWLPMKIKHLLSFLCIFRNTSKELLRLAKTAFLGLLLNSQSLFQHSCENSPNFNHSRALPRRGTTLQPLRNVIFLGKWTYIRVKKEFFCSSEIVLA